MFDNIPSSRSNNSIAGDLTSTASADLKNLNQNKDFPFKKIEDTTPVPTKSFSNAEDIFSTTEKGASGQVIRPLIPSNVQDIANPVINAMPNNSYARPNNLTMTAGASGGADLKKTLTVILILLIMAILVLAGWWTYGKFFADKSTDKNAPATVDFNSILKNLNDDLQKNTVQPVVDDENKTTEDNQNITIPAINTSTLPVLETDSDNDGLTDFEEDTLGTNPNKVDTDFDGLSDYDEVKVYFTNPLRADSDNDGFMDGLEVQNGYDPLGPGKLVN